MSWSEIYEIGCSTNVVNHWRLYRQSWSVQGLPWNKELELHPLSPRFHRMQNQVNRHITIHLIFPSHLHLIHFMDRYPLGTWNVLIQIHAKGTPWASGQSGQEQTLSVSQQALNSRLSVKSHKQTRYWTGHPQPTWMEVTETSARDGRDAAPAAAAQGSLPAAHTGFSFTNWQTSSWCQAGPESKQHETWGQVQK